MSSNTDNNNKQQSYNKHKVLTENLDRIVDELLSMFESTYGVKLSKTEKSVFDTKSKSILYYWLGIVYDEATMEVKNLEQALDVSKNISKKLKESHRELQAVIASSSMPPAANQILPPQISSYGPLSDNKVDPNQSVMPVSKSFADQIEGFYSHLHSDIVKGLNKKPKK